LVVGILEEFGARFLGDGLLVPADHLDPVLGLKIGVERESATIVGGDSCREGGVTTIAIEIGE
jgi:hypothetical protein